MSEERKTAWKAGEKMKFSVFAEVRIMDEDEGGNPTLIGARIDLGGDAKKDTNYEKILADLEKAPKEEILRMFHLTGLVEPEDVKIIPPEEYLEKYGQTEDIPFCTFGEDDDKETD